MYSSMSDFREMSHPAWVRGLKPGTILSGMAAGRSHPAWVRGLKRYDHEVKSVEYRRTPRGCVD